MRPTDAAVPVFFRVPLVQPSNTGRAKDVMPLLASPLSQRHVRPTDCDLSCFPRSLTGSRRNKTGFNERTHSCRNKSRSLSRFFYTSAIPGVEWLFNWSRSRNGQIVDVTSFGENVLYQKCNLRTLSPDVGGNEREKGEGINLARDS